MGETEDGPLRLLVVEDNDETFSALNDTLRFAADRQIEIGRARDLAEGRRLVAADAYTAVLLDLSLPDSEGLETVDGMVTSAGETPVVVLTSHDDDWLGEQAISRGAQDYLVKGRADTRAILRSVRYATERGRAKAELNRTVGELRQALVRVRKLEGLLRICSQCKRIVDDDTGDDANKERWVPLESYLDTHSEAQFSHGLCPQCAAEYYREMGIERPEAKQEGGRPDTPPGSDEPAKWDRRGK